MGTTRQTLPLLSVSAVAALFLLTACGHSHATSIQTDSTPVVYVTPSIHKVQLAVASRVLGKVPKRLALQRTECYHYGTSALNCFVDEGDASCTVVGVRQTTSGAIRYSQPFGYTICTTVGGTIGDGETAPRQSP